MAEETAAGDWSPWFHYAVATRPRSAGAENGDRHLVVAVPGGALIAVIDGLGHGREAAAAAEIAVRVVGDHASEPLPALVRRCHEALHRTRGAAMTLSLLTWPEGTLTWGGVGNVDGRLIRAASPERIEGALLLSGVVGYRIPPLRPTVIPLYRGDLLIMATDGILPRFTEGLVPGEQLQRMADRILDIHGRDDDALVLVARWSGVSQSQG